MTLCARCHPKKRRAEDKLCNRTNIVGWLQELNRIGFPMGKVRKAMEFYQIKGLPGINQGQKISARIVPGNLIFMLLLTTGAQCLMRY